MAGGGGHGGPDMTPMLDMVLQLLMYFIVCANLAGRAVNPGLVELLPESAVAERGNDDGEGGILYVNVTYNKENPADHRVIFLDKGPFGLSTESEMRKRDKYGYDAFEVALEDFAGYAKKDEKGKIMTTVILRADGRVGFGDVRNLMETFEKKGFKKFNMASTINRRE
jgi:biopolymer transport protein ExbD